ncbi:hypothetical protein E4U60_002804 [Claviceps pazoutovae]|uniref:Annexin ANXC4 n=1 Tax=Claviceps pazoutovae TaxID=1649127 RepID=A0A9P7MAP6_9HYPO|nr:hypothetical protein E4U60_002804 [Claviceps pazoutovae]
MSLHVAPERRRDRSASRERRSKDETARPSNTKFTASAEPRYVYPEHGLDGRYRSGSRQRDSAHNGGGGLPYPLEDDSEMFPGSQFLYADSLSVQTLVSPALDASSRGTRGRESTSHLPGAFPEEDPPRKDDGLDRRARYSEPGASRYDTRATSNEGYVDDLQSRRADSSRERHGREGAPRHKPWRDSREDLFADKLGFLPQKYSHPYGGEDLRGGRDNEYPEHDAGRRSYGDGDTRSSKQRDEDALAYGKLPGPSRRHRAESPQTYGSYISGFDGIYTSSSRHGREHDRQDISFGPNVDTRDLRKGREVPRRDEHRDSGSHLLTVEPKSRDRSRGKSQDKSRDRSRGKSRDKSRDRSRHKSRDRSRHKSRDKSRHKSQDRSRGKSRDRSRGRKSSSILAPVSDDRRARDASRHQRHASRSRGRSLQPPTARMSNVTLGVGLLSPSLSLSAPPPSPLLEAYKGTYQDCSPMPSPLLAASNPPNSGLRPLDSLSPISSDTEGDGKKRSRRARFHDPEAIAAQFAKALKGTRPPDTQPLIEILPSLTHHQVMELRSHYKRLVKTGSDRKGVNLAKHIRARLKDEPSPLMKACYAVALGQWESEAYWANFWYQGNKTCRELLIESLMGRTNAEIRHIKDAFADKKYDHNLAKCLRTELKEDKFKRAVLAVLEERRMEDVDSQGRRVALDYRLVEEDVVTLRKAVRAERGGESAMIGVVVGRSDGHLRAVLGEYERVYGGNFAREALRKSGNLVGEVLAHILNGVINRPVRDALLLHHALTASRKDDLRRELLISRLVRFHWDALHMQAVKKAYRERYGVDLSEAVRDGTSGQWGEFCRELCIARMPERVEIIH